ncbi:hypothetical protein Tco_0056714, partial [Tanacetum coccineum]
YEEELNASAIFMAKLTPAGSDNENDVGPSYDTDALSEVPNYENYHDETYNPFTQERKHSEQPVCVNDTYMEDTNDVSIV